MGSQELASLLSRDTIKQEERYYQARGEILPSQRRDTTKQEEKYYQATVEILPSNSREYQATGNTKQEVLQSIRYYQARGNHYQEREDRHYY